MAQSNRMDTKHPVQDLVGRGNRDGAQLFRDWFSALSDTAAQDGQAAYVFVMGSLNEILKTFDLPVVFPGFSWHNLKGAKLGSIPRLKGQFLWSKIVANKKAGANMLYIAMFDEVDQGTAIFKCTNDPPTSGGTKFLTYEGLPSDFYLQLAGQAGKLLRDEIPLNTTVPAAR